MEYFSRCVCSCCELVWSGGKVMGQFTTFIVVKRGE